MGVQADGAGGLPRHGTIKQIDSGLPHGVNSLGHDGQSGIGEAEYRQVVETDQINLVTDPDPLVNACLLYTSDAADE